MNDTTSLLTRPSHASSPWQDKLSVRGVKWALHDIAERDVLWLTQQHHISSLLARVILARGIAPDQSPLFLNPTIRDSLSDPFELKDMAKAVERIIAACHAKERIGILGDFDVDGATSSAVLSHMFSFIDIAHCIYIPDRIEEGYGPSNKAMDYFKSQQVSLVMTLDCGTVSYEPIAYARSLGLEVIVVDHHLGGEILPDALAVINPNRLDETSPHHYLAAVGVTFLLCVALNSSLRKAGFYQDRHEPNLLTLLDLVALGTVCDVMPLTGMNRSFVKQGLAVLATRQHVGLRALADVAKLSDSPSTYHLGFVLGPRINAGGRVGKSDLGAKLLTTEDEQEALAIAEQLDILNQERKALEQAALEQAISQVEMAAAQDAPILIAASTGWHPGIIGIVAGRLKEQFDRPAIVIALNNDMTVGKGSARSIATIDIGTLIASAKAEGLLEAGGGHKMAGGLTINPTQLDRFSDYMTEACQAGYLRHKNEKRLLIDGIVSVAGITVDLVESIQAAAPFGVGNAKPRFALCNAVVTKVDVMGEDHLRLFIADDARSGKGQLIKAVCFRVIGTPLGDALLAAQGKRIHIAGQLDINRWQGRESVEFHIEDVMF